MNKKVILFFIVLLVLTSFTVSKEREVYVSSEVISQAEEEGKVDVIIKFKEPPIQKSVNALSEKNKLQVRTAAIKKEQTDILENLKKEPGFELKRRYSIVNGVTAKVSREVIENLRENPNIEGIYYDELVYGFLNESAPLIETDSFLNIRINNQEVNGTGETVCIIDTGVDYTHTALGGCYGNNDPSSSCKVIGGYDFVNNDADPMDDQGHGTHVAGIVSSINETYKGIAPGTKIIAIKALNDSKVGLSSDVDLGIEWCINNASKFNISVISMSLGSGAYSSYCDSSDPTTSALVGEAVSQGIFVTAASGNNGYTSFISTPACLKNVTSVGAVYDADSGGWNWGGTCIDFTTGPDNITCFSNSASFLDLLAPGAIITSANWTGNFEGSGGTSQATPHVAAAAALIFDFKKRENESTYTPKKIEDILKITGKNLTDDRNGYNFSRINLTSALSYIDDTPRLTFISSTDIGNISANNTYVNITTSEPLANATIEIDGTNKTMNGSNKNFYYNITLNSDGEHNFTIHIQDSTGNSVSSNTYVFDVDTTKPNITDVVNETLLTGFIVYFNTSEPALAKIHYGTTSGVYNNEASNTNEYTTKHNISLTGLASYTTYYYIINATDNVGNSNITKEYNYTTGLIDLTYPYWSNNSTYPVTGTTAHNKSKEYQFNVTWQDNIEISSVWIEHNFSGNSENSSISGNKSNVYYFNISGISAGKHFWRMYANDTSDNTNFTNTYFYTVSRASSSVNISLNGTESDKTINQTAVLNITANTTGDHKILLYVNGTLINNQTILVENLTTFTRKGLYNITVKYPLSQNYTSSTKTLWVTVLDSLPPEINITSPINHTLYSSNPLINVSTSESASCNYTLNTGTNSTLTSLNRVHTASLSLPDGTYNITISCRDSAGFTGTSEAVNFSIDTTSPVVNITYPIENTRIGKKSIQVNYTVNETNFDSAWYFLNHNITKISLNPTNTQGGNNSRLINFRRPGKQVLIIYTNDTSGNVGSKTLAFFVNTTLNTTKWITDFSNIENNITTIEIFNSSYINLSQNISLDQDLSLEINLTNVTMNTYNFSASNAAWDYFFQVSDNSSYFESQINTRYGTQPVHYIYVTNFSFFINESSDYYGRIRLPENKTDSYGNLYYCSKDDLSDCNIIGVCSGDYTESDTNACYNETGRYTYVYVPHFSSVFGDNDTVAPVINITSPENNSVLQASYNRNIIFSTNENSTCQHLISGGAWTTSVTTDSKYFTARYNFTSNTDYNLTVNCTDSTGNLRSSQINFSINDTTAPTFSSGPSDSADTDSITIDFTANEPANYTARMNGESPKRSSSFSLSRSVEFTGLDSDTDYDYNITLCDRLENCHTYTGYSEDTDASDNGGDDDDSGTGPGGGTDTDITAPTKVSQVYYSPEKGQHTMSIASTKIAFTIIIFTLNKQVNGTVLMNVEQRDLPSFIDPLPGDIYQYIKIDKSLIQDEDVTNALIKFRVTKNWINNNNVGYEKISLYRYTTSWTEIDTVKTNEDNTYVYYESDSPGLSYFAIKGEERDEVEEIVEEEDDQPPAPTGDVIKDVSQKGNEEEEETQTKGKFPWGIISIIFIFIIVGGVVGFLLYQKSVSVLSDQELRELDEYVQKCKSEGIEFKHIKSTLLKVGWPEYVVDLVIHDVHIPAEDRKKLIAYIKKARKLNKKDEDIRLALKKVGWQEEIIDEAFKKA